MKEPEPKAASGRRLRLALALAGVALAVAALLLYATRRTLARDALTAWLRGKGVPASAEIAGVGLTGVSGRLVIGDPARPDFVAERVEVGYDLAGLGLHVRSVRLVRPVLRASWRGGRFSAGALDRLIAEFRKAPPRPGAPQPKVTLEDGRLLLATDYGPLQVDADGLVEAGRLQRLAARLAPARLRGPGFDVSFGPAALSAEAAGERLELSLDAPIASAAAGPVSAANARLRATAAGPYPDFARRREQGPVVAHAELAGGRLAYAGQGLRSGLVSAVLTGEASGWIGDLTLAGRAAADLRAAGADAVGGTAGALRAAASAEQLRWTRQGGDRVEGRLAANAALDSFVRGGLKFTGLTAAVRGPAGWSAKGAALDLTARAAGHGAWTALAPAGGDSAEIAAAKRAARGFRFTAPSLAIAGAGGAVSARLLEPARLSPDRGGLVTLAPRGAGWRLTAAGGGLPKIDAGIDRFALPPGGAEAALRLRAQLSIGPVRQGVFDAAGVLRADGQALSFTADRCARLIAARLDFGTNDVRGFKGALCPAGGPLISLGRGGWRIAGRSQDLSGEIPFLQARFAKAAGALDLSETGGVQAARASLAGAEVSDAAPETRFNPVVASGQAQLARGLWTSTLSVRDGAGRPIARVALKHASASGRGGADIETGRLTFAPGALQPAELSPIAALIGSPAEGEARFSGGFAWTPTAQASSGVLEVPRLDFQSPAGKVSGLSGRIAFDSLAPLTAAPGQTLQAAEIASPLAPLKGARAVFALEPKAIRVSSAEAAVGGGVARIESLEVPLAKGQPLRGVLDLEGVQLHDLVEASPFGDRVDLQAKVSGRLPFVVEGEKVRITGGGLHAVEPGRLSIQRAALTGVAASGEVAAPGAPAPPAPSTDTFSDFAYQAMENLAFSTLSAEVSSRPDGRLGVVFHIIGKHDPPQHQEIRLSWLDLVRKRFMDRKLPLPSGTGVDLTLDTTLNLDDLLGDYAEFRRLHGSAQVQP